MSLLKLIFAECVGMFVDDAFLALAVLAVVALAAALGFWMSAPQWLTGGVLVAGCFGVLTASVLRASLKNK